MLADFDWHFSDQLPETVGLKTTELDPAIARRSAVVSTSGIAVRSASSVMVLLSAGYGPEAASSLRRLLEAKLNAQAVFDDATGQYAIRYLQGRPRGTTKLAQKYGDAEEIELLSTLTHISGAKPWAIEPKGPCVGNLHVWSTKGNPRNRSGYGRFYARFRINCESAVYRTTVNKITKIFRMVGGDPIRYKVDVPPVANGQHWQGEWGNWDESKPAVAFDCLLKQEYEYVYMINIEWASILGIAGEAGASLFPPGSGTLTLSAQEYCGHGPY